MKASFNWLIFPSFTAKKGKGEQKNVNKKELGKELAKRTGLTQDKANSVLNELILIIQEELKKNEAVRISGLGIFKVVERKERRGRNPQTGEEIIIPAKRVPKFVPAKDLKNL